MGSGIHVRRATDADADALSRLAADTFRDTFAADNTPEDLAAYLAETFSPALQRAEIADRDATILLAERGDLVGYAHLVVGPAPVAVRGPSPIELARIYVARPWQGRGVASALMDAVLDAARSRGARTLWLGVWERNPRAVAFYEKYGFERVGEQPFRLGSDVQNDWILARPVADPGAHPRRAQPGD